MKILFKSGFIMLLILAVAHMSYADIATIAVSPVTKSIALSKGETKSGTFVVFNKSDEAQHVTVEPRYWYMVDENRVIPLDSWLKITPNEFEIEPNGKSEVTFSVSVPQEALGELAAMIAFRPERKEGQAVNVVFSVSLYAVIKGTENIDCKIGNFSLWKFEDRNALGAKIVLRNDGNVHLKPKITVYIQDIFNKNLQKTVLKYGKPTYPGEIQDYQGAIYNFKLKPGIYKAAIDTEFTNITGRFRKRVYFLVGREGKVIFTFFRRQK